MQMLLRRGDGGSADKTEAEKMIALPLFLHSCQKKRRCVTMKLNSCLSSNFPATIFQPNVRVTAHQTNWKRITLLSPCRHLNLGTFFQQACPCASDTASQTP